MTIHFHCGCGQKLKASAEAIGRHFDCPVCGTEVVVPERDESEPQKKRASEASVATSVSHRASKDATKSRSKAVGSPPIKKKKVGKSATNGSHSNSSDDDVAMAALGLSDDPISSSDTGEISKSDTQELLTVNAKERTPLVERRLPAEALLLRDEKQLAELERLQESHRRTAAAQSDDDDEVSTSDTARDLYKLVRKMKKDDPGAAEAVKRKKEKQRRVDEGERFDFGGFFSEMGRTVIPGIAAVVLVCFGAYWLSSSVMSSGRGLPELGRVSGVITLDGEPLPGATVTFLPAIEDEEQASRIASSMGVTDEQGSYSLMYVKDVAGAAVGPHHVAISAPQPNGAEGLPRKYNTSSELSFEVEPGKNDASFELASK